MLTMTLPVTQTAPPNAVAYPQHFLQPMVPARIQQMKAATDFEKIDIKDGQIAMSQKQGNTFNTFDTLLARQATQNMIADFQRPPI